LNLAISSDVVLVMMRSSTYTSLMSLLSPSLPLQ
jgi:hypothetical protein